MMNLLLAACMHLATATQGADDQTRGIGQYPGHPDEYFAPTVSWTSSDALTNVALHRAAWASSTCDYNHTAHLVTDGICDTSEPATITVTTPAGRLPRREAEWSIDGGPFSRTILMGSSSWLQFDWGGALTVTASKLTLQGMVAYDDKVATKGFTILCQTSADGQSWQTVGELKGDKLPGTPLHYKLHSDHNKQEKQELLPARVLNEVIRLNAPVTTSHLRLVVDMAGAAPWDIRELQFKDAAGNDVEVMPSRAFSSMWISDDGNGYRASVTLSNKSKVPAPFVRLNLTGEDGEQILPVAYSDNYITLMPGEQKTINVTWRKEDARGQQPRIEITGIN
jgi:hypothetical protein